MIIEYIERLRREPKEVRQRAVFTWTALIVGIIVVLYIVFFVRRVTTSDEPQNTNTLAAPYSSER